MRGHLIQIDAQDSAGNPAPIRLASVDDRRLCHIDSSAWVPAIATLPTLTYDFFGGDFAGRIATPAGTFTAALSGLPDQADQRFAGSRVRIWSGEVGAALDQYVPRFDGRLAAEPATDSGIASFEITVDDAWLDKPLLSLFAGTGGAEGPDDLEGTVKQLVLGSCRFVPGVLIDAVDLIYYVSGRGATRAYDRVISLGASAGDHPDLAALLAANLRDGSWATCNALGLVRLASPPDGQVSFDVTGPALATGEAIRLPGAMIGYIAGLVGGTVNQRNLDLLDKARPWPQSLVLAEQTTAREVIQTLADGVCAVAGLSHLGVLFALPLGYSEPTLVLDALGRSDPPVSDVAVQSVQPPYWRLATNAEPTWVVHDSASIGTAYNYRGKWDPERVYRLDDMVSLDGGSMWIYIGPLASAGVEPGTNAAVWQQYEGDATYPDGTPIGDLQPAQPGADVTGDNTSKDTDAVDGVPASEVITRIAAAQTAIADIESLTDGILGDFGDLQETVGGLSSRVLAAEGEIDTVVETQQTYGAEITEIKQTASTQAGELAELTTQVSTGNAAFEERITAVEDDASALAERASSLEANLSGPDGALARIEDLDQAMSDGDQALAQRASNIEASVEGAEAHIEQVETAASQANEAVAQRASNLEAAVGGPGGVLSRLSTTESVASSASGTADTALSRVASAMWQKTATAGNGRAQMTLYAFDDNGNVQAGVDIIGDLTLSGSLFVNGSITTDKVAPGSMTGSAAVRSSGGFDTAWVTVAEINYDVRAVESGVEVTASCLIDLAPAPAANKGYVRLLRDNTYVDIPELEIARSGSPAPFSFPVLLSGLSGARNWKLQTRALNSPADGAENHAALLTQISIKEFKR